MAWRHVGMWAICKQALLADLNRYGRDRSSICTHLGGNAVPVLDGRATVGTCGVVVLCSKGRVAARDRRRRATCPDCRTPRSSRATCGLIFHEACLRVHLARPGATVAAIHVCIRRCAAGECGRDCSREIRSWKRPQRFFRYPSTKNVSFIDLSGAC